MQACVTAHAGADISTGNASCFDWHPRAFANERMDHVNTSAVMRYMRPHCCVPRCAGANDLANSFATSLGSRALSLGAVRPASLDALQRAVTTVHEAQTALQLPALMCQASYRLTTSARATNMAVWVCRWSALPASASFWAPCCWEQMSPAQSSGHSLLLRPPPNSLCNFCKLDSCRDMTGAVARTDTRAEGTHRLVCLPVGPALQTSMHSRTRRCC